MDYCTLSPYHRGARSLIPLKHTVYAAMELVKELVRKAVHLLNNDLIDSIMTRLEAMAIGSVDDLNFVMTEDTDGILPPIHFSKLSVPVRLQIPILSVLYLHV